MIPITPVYIPDTGGCDCSVIRLLFDYYKIHNFNRIYEKNNSISLNRPISGNLINQIIKYDYTDYDDIILYYFNINVNKLKRDVQEIKNYLSRKHPVIVKTKTYMCPWRENDSTENHCCLILDYDDMKKAAICVDPVFTDKLVLFPETNILDNITTLSVIDTSDLRYKEPLSLYYSIQEWLKNNSLSINTMETICNIMKTSVESEQVDSDMIESYLLNSKNSFDINKRYIKIMHYFTYLKEIHNTPWFDQVIELYETNYKNTINLYSMLMKYQITGNQKILHRYLDTIDACNKSEKRANEIICKFAF